MAAAARGRFAVWQQILVIVICLATAGALTWRFTRPEILNGHIPEDFPHTWIAQADDGKADKVVIIRARNEPDQPYEKDGVKLFHAFACLNPKCPGRKNDQPFIFAHWNQRPCPKCNAVDLEVVQRYETPEGEAILAPIRASFGK